MKNLIKLLTLISFVCLLSLPIIFTNNYELKTENQDVKVTHIPSLEEKYENQPNPQYTADETEVEMEKSTHSSSASKAEEDNDQENDDEEEKVITKHTIKFKVNPLNDEEDKGNPTKDSDKEPDIPPPPGSASDSSSSSTSSTSKTSLKESQKSSDKNNADSKSLSPKKSESSSEKTNTKSLMKTSNPQNNIK